MKSLTYSFDDISFRFISTLTGVSDFNGEGLGTISIESLVNPTKILGSADGQVMTLKMPNTKARFKVTTPQVSRLAKKLWNNLMLLSKANSTVWNTNQAWIRETGSGMEIMLTFVSYEKPPELIFTSRGTFTEFTFVAESMNVLCL